MYKFFFIIIIPFLSFQAWASGTMSESEFVKVNKKPIMTDADRKNIEQVAVTLASYEFEASKLVDLVDEQLARKSIDKQARRLMSLSEKVLEWGRFRLAQCDDYISRSLELKQQLGSISHASLESDYHHDGRLPEAPPECYHMKDLFVHPATVLVLTRDDPAMDNETRNSIKAEITEVLAHAEVVRQLVLY